MGEAAAKDAKARRTGREAARRTASARVSRKMQQLVAMSAPLMGLPQCLLLVVVVVIRHRQLQVQVLQVLRVPRAPVLRVDQAPMRLKVPTSMIMHITRTLMAMAWQIRNLARLTPDPRRKSMTGRERRNKTKEG